MTSIKSRAPVRVSFAGGGTDVPPFSEKYGGCVVSCTIDKYVRVDVSSSGISDAHVVSAIDLDKKEVLPAGVKYIYSTQDSSQNPKMDLVKAILNIIPPGFPCDIYIHGDAPAGSGLGTSSSVAVALIGAVLTARGERIDKKSVAEKAIEIERNILKRTGGLQDQYAASYGGFNFIEFLPNGVRVVTPLDVPEIAKKELRESLTLFHLTGEHVSADQQVKLVEAMKTKETIEALQNLKKLTIRIKEALERGDLTTFGKLLDQGWQAKKSSSSAISNLTVDRFYDSALSFGALGGKLLGAGGTGYLLLFVPKENRMKVENELARQGARQLDFDFEQEGLVIES